MTQMLKPSPSVIAGDERKVEKRGGEEREGGKEEKGEKERERRRETESR